MQDPAQLLGPDGPLIRAFPGFQPREQQQAMAQAVAAAIEGRSRLIIEAGTGTGKTLAYLTPALVSDARVVVSTATRTLQDQLYRKDLPRLREALQTPVRIALLKGRSNYLCRFHLERTLQQAWLESPQEAKQLEKIQAWSRRTLRGDIGELAEIPEEAPIWSRVTSTRDNCLGSECPHLEDCHLAHARKKALEADLVVVNHHLLLSDLALRDEGFGNLLPEADAVILDEAHQIPEIAGTFFALSLGSRQLEELARDARRGAEEAAPEVLADYQTQEKALVEAINDLRDRLPPPGRHPGDRLPEDTLSRLGPPLEALEALLERDAPRDPLLANLHRRCEQHHHHLKRLAGPVPDNEVRWLESRPHSFTLHQEPLDIAPRLRRAMDERPCAWIFTSATLTVGGDFGHYQRRMGLNDAITHAWESPFDYPHNALLVCPADIPDPNHPDHTAAVVELAIPLIQAAGGRTFLLFTSHRALRQAAERLRPRLDLPLHVQGEGARGRLLQRFREQPESVLLGTGSFWEGVDVQGPALSCVIIDKLPFSHPDDPVLQARLKAIEARGDNPFMNYTLPQAVTSLRQGVGRLIRGPDDRGVMVIADRRLVERPYGRLFLDSLPPMARTRRLAVAEAFLKHHLATETP